MKTANRPQMAAIADARNSAAISRDALAKSSSRGRHTPRDAAAAPASLSPVTTAAVSPSRDLKNGGSLKSPRRRRPERQCQPLATGYREHSRRPCWRRLARAAVWSRPVRQACFVRINRALNFASHPHHVRVFQIPHPIRAMSSSNVCDQVLDLARSSRLDMGHAFAQIVLEATSGRTVPAQWFRRV